jgi:hypothetical protein
LADVQAATITTCNASITAACDPAAVTDAEILMLKVTNAES